MSRDNRGPLVESDQVESDGSSGPGVHQLQGAADTLRALAHPHRLRMLAQLRQSARTVGWLAEDCGIRQHAASEHLRLMQKLDFVSSQRQGRFTYYRLKGSAGRQLIDMLESWCVDG